MVTRGSRVGCALRSSASLARWLHAGCAVVACPLSVCRTCALVSRRSRFGRASIVRGLCVGRASLRSRSRVDVHLPHRLSGVVRHSPAFLGVAQRCTALHSVARLGTSGHRGARRSPAGRRFRSAHWVGVRKACAFGVRRVCCVGIRAACCVGVRAASWAGVRAPCWVGVCAACCVGVRVAC